LTGSPSGGHARLAYYVHDSREDDGISGTMSESHCVSEDRMAAQGVMLQAILGSAADESGLSCVAESELKP